MKELLGISTILALAVLIGCKPPQTSGEQPAACSVTDLRADVNNGSMVVSWEDDCGRLISGYNIYISEDPLVATYPGTSIPNSIEPHNTSPYPGDTDPDNPRQHYEAERLENGVRYYVSIRVVYGDQTMSPPSKEITAVCAPRGDITLGVRYGNNLDGYSFVDGQYVEPDATSNDIYYFNANGEDFLASPMRLGFLKDNRLRVLPYSGSMDEVAKRAKTDSAVPTADKVQIKPGDWVWIYMPDKTTALVKVGEFKGSGDARTVNLSFAYYPIPGELLP